MAGDAQIERCAKVCDSMALELEQLKPSARRGKYDRQTARQIDYAVRSVRRVAERIRALKSVAADAQAVPGNGDRLAIALEIVREMRPVIAATRKSAWRTLILQKLDELLG